MKLYPVMLAGLLGGSLFCHAVDCQELDTKPLLALKPDFLLLGEMHGTEQSPAFAAELACRLLADGQALLLGVELPPAEQPRLDAYLQSNGDEKARQALLAGPHWDSAKWADGRSSEAMLKLIERMRQLRQAGKPVELLAFADGGDAGYAQVLTKSQLRRKQRVLVLVGNIHANRAEKSSYTGLKPMGALLAEYGRTVSLNVSYPGGKAWLCLDDFGCGAHALQGSPKALAAGQISLVQARRDNIWLYDGWYDVGELSPSPPARSTTKLPG